MPRLAWDEVATKFFEVGITRGVVYVMKDIINDDDVSDYNYGVSWNGLISVDVNHEGFEATNFSNDGEIYATLRTPETISGTIEAYSYPIQFKPCDGVNVASNGVYISQQDRIPFGLCFRTEIGNDVDNPGDAGYIIHVLYGCVISPASTNYESANPCEYSWEFSTDPSKIKGYSPFSEVLFDSRYIPSENMQVIEDTLYGTNSSEPTLPKVEALLELADSGEFVPYPSISIDPLSINQNGIYSAPTGHAYSPVTVSVQGSGGSNQINDAFISGNSIDVCCPDIINAPDYMLANAQGIRSLDFPVCTTIGSSAFAGCINLISVNFPSCVTISIGAFYSCYNLQFISFNSECSTIGGGAFARCSSLVSADFPSCKYVPGEAFRDCQILETVSFHSECSSIGNLAFANCINFSSAIFEKCTRVGWYAFSGCSNLSLISFPVCSIIESYAFKNCTSITSAVFPLCTNISSGAFQYCTGLLEASFPMCTSIHNGWGNETINSDGVFMGCTSLQSIYFPICSYIGLAAFTDCDSLETVIFPCCNTIGSGAFAYCNILRNAEFSSCTKISGGAFRNCFRLKYVSFHSECSSIGSYAFANCSSLVSVSFPLCKAINPYTYSGCQNLVSVVFHSECSSIGSYAFANCSSLVSVSFPLCSSIGSHAFENCLSIVSVSFPLCSSVGSYAFANCSNLSFINLPNCVRIFYGTFVSCSNLSVARFSKCTYIASRNYAYGPFEYCSKLSALYLYSPTVATLANNTAFLCTPLADSSYLGYYGSIYVPASLVSSYKVAANWSWYSNRITAIVE